MSSLSRKFSPLLIVAIVSFAAAPAGAAKYFADASVIQEVYYDGNIVLDEIDKEEVEAYSLAPKLKLAGQGANWQANLDTELRFTRLSNQLYDSDDQIVDLSLRRYSERQAWQLDGSIARESTRTSDDSLDRVLAATRVEDRSVRPAWTRVLNEKNTLSLGANWLELEYQDPDLSDFEQYAFDANWIRQLDQRLSLQVAAYQSRLQVGDAPAGFFASGLARLESDTVGLSAGLTRQFNEQLTGSITLGARQVDTKSRSVFFIFPITQESDSSGYTAAADIGYAGEIWSGSANLSRSLNPSGLAGELLETDALSLEYSRQVRENLRFEMTLELTSENSLEGSTFKRDRWRAIPALRWRFSERWTLVTKLRYRVRDSVRTVPGGLEVNDADSTALIFNVRYAHPRAIWSR